MMVAIIFGILVAHIYNELFFVCILIGFVLSLLLLRYVLSHASGRSEVELGQAAMTVGYPSFASSFSINSNCRPYIS